MSELAEKVKVLCCVGWIGSEGSSDKGRSLPPGIEREEEDAGQIVVLEYLHDRQVRTGSVRWAEGLGFSI
jgi:hypothetical protein